jgi:hypothetical protein
LTEYPVCSNLTWKTRIHGKWDCSRPEHPQPVGTEVKVQLERSSSLVVESGVIYPVLSSEGEKWCGIQYCLVRGGPKYQRRQARWIGSEVLEEANIFTGPFQAVAWEPPDVLIEGSRHQVESDLFFCMFVQIEEFCSYMLTLHDASYNNIGLDH